jgi:hypothetical protein
MVDFSKYSEAEGLFIVSIEAKDDPDWRSMHMGIRLGEEYQKQLDICNIKTAVRALEAAWMYENNLAILEAGKYYELASQLSEYKVYSEIYDLFRNKYAKMLARETNDQGY